VGFDDGVRLHNVSAQMAEPLPRLVVVDISRGSEDACMHLDACIVDLDAYIVDASRLHCALLRYQRACCEKP
jgi:hypothetical protein